MQGKAKHAKWAEYKDLSAADAQKKYVEAVKKLVAQYRHAAKGVPGSIR